MSASSSLNAFTLLGEEVGLRSIIDDFIDRVARDLMIGFYFRGVDLERLKQREFEFVRQHLGGRRNIKNRQMKKTHAPRSIMGGHFNRRLVLLEQTLRAHHAPEEAIQLWPQHNREPRSQITKDASGECIG